MSYDGGDHTIVVGRVRDLAAFTQPPLLFHRGSYGIIASCAASSDANGSTPSRNTSRERLMEPFGLARGREITSEASRDC